MARRDRNPFNTRFGADIAGLGAAFLESRRAGQMTPLERATATAELDQTRAAANAQRALQRQRAADASIAEAETAARGTIANAAQSALFPEPAPEGIFGAATQDVNQAAGRRLFDEITIPRASIEAIRGGVDPQDLSRNIAGILAGFGDETRAQQVLGGGGQTFDPFEGIGPQTQAAGEARQLAGQIARDEAKPTRPGTVSNFRFPDGTVRPIRAGSPEEDAAIAANALKVGVSGTPDQVGADTATKTNVTRAQQVVDNAKVSRNVIDAARGLAGDASFGIVGQVETTISDLSQLGGEVGRFANRMAQEGGQIEQEIANDLIDAGVEGPSPTFFNPNQRNIDFITNVLAYRWVKTNDDSGRVSNEDFQIARDQFSGSNVFQRMLGSREAFTQALDQFEFLVNSRERTAMQRLGQDGTSAPAQAAPAGQADPNADLRARRDAALERRRQRGQ